MKNSSKKAGPSGMTNKEYAKSVIGGVPPKKTVQQIEKVNSPSGRGRAPGSVRI